MLHHHNFWCIVIKLIIEHWLGHHIKNVYRINLDAGAILQSKCGHSDENLRGNRHHHPLGLPLNHQPNESQWWLNNQALHHWHRIWLVHLTHLLQILAVQQIKVFHFLLYRNSISFYHFIFTLRKCLLLMNYNK